MLDHRQVQALLAGAGNGDVVPRIGMAHDSRAGIVPQHAANALGRRLAAVAHDDHPGVLRVAHADPASEWCLVVAALDGEMVAQSTGGTRIIPARDYFRGVMTTALKEDELLTEVRLPILPADTRFGFYEFSRRAGDFALAMALATFRLRDGLIIEPRVAVGSVEARPRRLAQAEDALVGRAPERTAFEAAAAAAEAAVDPLDDIITGADYRRDLARTITRRALERAAA